MNRGVIILLLLLLLYYSQLRLTCVNTRCVKREKSDHMKLKPVVNILSVSYTSREEGTLWIEELDFGTNRERIQKELYNFKGTVNNKNINNL